MAATFTAAPLLQPRPGPTTTSFPVQQRRHYNQQQSRSRYGRLREGTTAQASSFEIDVKMDEVKEALNSCGTVQKAWSWAIENIWGVSAVPDSASTSGPSTPGPAAPPPYGIRTALYAPAIHYLFLHFRDSLRSPHAALQVLDVTSALSPESLVLGSTPALYADVVKLHWSLRRDLAGVKNTVHLARRIGLLSKVSPESSSSDASSSLSSSRPYRYASPVSSRGSASPTSASSSEDAALRAQIEIAIDEARREALRSQTEPESTPLSENNRSTSSDSDGRGGDDGDDSRWDYPREKPRPRVLNRAQRRASLAPKLTWAYQQQLALADEIANLLRSDVPVGSTQAGLQ